LQEISGRYTFVSKLQHCFKMADKMTDTEIKDWMSAGLRVSAFIQWAAVRCLEKDTKPISRTTYYRSIREESKTPRQKLALELAQQYYTEKTAQVASPAAA
jgi:hypothetical protein